jgi:DNA-binding MarR family transcriptional regulator
VGTVVLRVTTSVYGLLSILRIAASGKVTRCDLVMIKNGRWSRRFVACSTIVVRVSLSVEPSVEPIDADGEEVASAAPTTVRWLSDDQQRDWRAFFYASLRLLEAIDRELLQEFGIPHGYYEIFVRLSEADDRSMRMSELATATRSSRSRLSHAVARLEESGWVERVDCVTDRRGQVAHLTDDGMDLLGRAAPYHVASVRRLLVDALTPEQFHELGDIGRIVHRNVTGEDVNAP